MSFSSRCAGPEAPARRAAALALLAAICAASEATESPAAVPPSEVRADLPGARLQGQGQLRFLGLLVYDIRLWSSLQLRADDPMRTEAALEIEYARRFKGPLIAERSLAEMQRVGAVSASDSEHWLRQMKQLFPDVETGDRITCVHRPGRGARFHVNGRLAGEVRDAEFARLFFGIWLSTRTSEPQLRTALLGPGS